MPFRGGVRREELDPSGHETPFDLVRETLEGLWRLGRIGKRQHR